MQEASDQIVVVLKKKNFNLNLVNMVDWTDAERAAIVSLWGKINVAEIGPQALAR